MCSIWLWPDDSSVSSSSSESAKHILRRVNVRFGKWRSAIHKKMYFLTTSQWKLTTRANEMLFPFSASGHHGQPYNVYMLYKCVRALRCDSAPPYTFHMSFNTGYVPPLRPAPSSPPLMMTMGVAIPLRSLPACLPAYHTTKRGKNYCFMMA